MSDTPSSRPTTSGPAMSVSSMMSALIFRVGCSTAAVFRQMCPRFTPSSSNSGGSSSYAPVQGFASWPSRDSTYEPPPPPPNVAPPPPPPPLGCGVSTTSAAPPAGADAYKLIGLGRCVGADVDAPNRSSADVEFANGLSVLAGAAAAAPPSPNRSTSDDEGGGDVAIAAKSSSSTSPSPPPPAWSSSASSSSPSSSSAAATSCRPHST
mmetsp:Transcript_26235/g.63778  ORF Transcript_26235/g.63778 Transcript_26235/m.63778 type:complete len:209 (+) Transcript_26235:102-728(+)